MNFQFHAKRATLSKRTCFQMIAAILLLLPSVSTAQRVTGYGTSTFAEAWSSIVGQAGTSTVSVSAFDDGTASIAMPFAFPFDGGTVASGSSVTISSNGFISFGSEDNGCCNDNVSSTGYPNSVLFYSTDLYILNNTNVYTRVTGSSPNRVLTIEWPTMRHYNSNGNSTGFQVRLKEGSGIIEMLYKNFNLDLTNSTFYSPGVGLNGSSSPSFAYKRYGGVFYATPTTHIRWTPSLGLLMPDGGETWCAGSTQSIQWTSNGIANVKLEYSSNSGTNWNTIVSSTSASAGSYSWSLPTSLTAASTYIVRISNASDASVYSTGSTFTVQAPAVLALSVSPAIIFPNDGTLENITVTATLTGGCSASYVLGSITSNETLAAGDVAGATTGTADLAFQLKGTRGDQLEPRYYNLNYTLSGQTETRKVLVGRNLGTSSAAASGSNIPTITSRGDLTASGNIAFTLPAATNVTFVIYDGNGKEVRTLLNSQSLGSGAQAVTWDLNRTGGSAAPDGVYYCQVRTSTAVSAPMVFGVDRP